MLDQIFRRLTAQHGAVCFRMRCARDALGLLVARSVVVRAGFLGSPRRGCSSDNIPALNPLTETVVGGVVTSEWPRRNPMGLYMEHGWGMHDPGWHAHGTEHTGGSGAIRWRAWALSGLRGACAGMSLHTCIVHLHWQI